MRFRLSTTYNSVSSLLLHDVTRSEYLLLYYFIALGFLFFWWGGLMVQWLALLPHTKYQLGVVGSISFWSLHVLPMTASVVSRYILPYSKDINLDYRSSSYSTVNWHWWLLVLPCKPCDQLVTGVPRFSPEGGWDRLQFTSLSWTTFIFIEEQCKKCGCWKREDAGSRYWYNGSWGQLMIIYRSVIFQKWIHPLVMHTTLMQKILYEWRIVL